MKNPGKIQPQIAPVKEIIIPEATNLRLDNGVPVYLIEAGNEDIVRIEFSFRAGQATESIPLLASTTNAMLKEGSQNFNSEKLNSMIDFFGAFLNLSIDKDRAGVSLYILNKHLHKILELSQEIILRPVFPLAELNALIKKRLQWYSVNKEKVQNMASDKFFESIFGAEHPYGYQVTESDFDKMSPELLAEFHSSYYDVSNMAIIVSGKIEKNTIPILNSFYGNIHPKLTEVPNEKGSFSEGKEKKVQISKSDAVQASIRIGSSTINKRHNDYPGLKVVDALLGGYFGSRLMKNIREDKGYTYGIGSTLTSLNLSGFKVISSDVSRLNCRSAIDEIYKEIQTLQTTTVEKDELSVVKNYMWGEMVRMFDGPFALAESFKSVWEFGLDNKYYYKLAEKIKTIEPDEISYLAKTYYNIDDLYEITAGEV